MIRKILLWKEEEKENIKIRIELLCYNLRADSNLYQIHYKENGKILQHSKYFTNINQATNTYIKYELKFFSTNK